MSDLPSQNEDELNQFHSGDPDIDNLNRFQALIQKQDDRGLVLSLAAFAEDTLGRLLLTYLKECKQSKDLVEGFNAPLGTFSSRIKASYSVGLLTREQHDDLEISRKVRNAFAHDWEGITLNRPDIKSMISQLHGYTVDQQPLEDGTRERLLGSITTILLELRVQITQHKKNSRRAPFVGFRLTTIKPVR